MATAAKAAKAKASKTKKPVTLKANRKLKKHGGAVKGPTSPPDQINARLTGNEYVLPADTTAAVGVPALDRLRAATHRFQGGGLVEQNMGAVRNRSQSIDSAVDRAAGAAPAAPVPAPAPALKGPLDPEPLNNEPRAVTPEDDPDYWNPAHVKARAGLRAKGIPGYAHGGIVWLANGGLASWDQLTDLAKLTMGGLTPEQRSKRLGTLSGIRQASNALGNTSAPDLSLMPGVAPPQGTQNAFGALPSWRRLAPVQPQPQPQPAVNTGTNVTPPVPPATATQSTVFGAPPSWRTPTGGLASTTGYREGGPVIVTPNIPPLVAALGGHPSTSQLSPTGNQESPQQSVWGNWNKTGSQQGLGFQRGAPIVPVPAKPALYPTTLNAARAARGIGWQGLFYPTDLAGATLAEHPNAVPFQQQQYQHGGVVRLQEGGLGVGYDPAKMWEAYRQSLGNLGMSQNMGRMAEGAGYQGPGIGTGGAPGPVPGTSGYAAPSAGSVGGGYSPQATEQALRSTLGNPFKGSMAPMAEGVGYQGVGQGFGTPPPQPAPKLAVDWGALQQARGYGQSTRGPAPAPAPAPTAPAEPAPVASPPPAELAPIKTPAGWGAKYLAEARARPAPTASAAGMVLGSGLGAYQGATLPEEEIYRRAGVQSWQQQQPYGGMTHAIASGVNAARQGLNYGAFGIPVGDFTTWLGRGLGEAAARARLWHAPQYSASSPATGMVGPELTDSGLSPEGIRSVIAADQRSGLPPTREALQEMEQEARRLHALNVAKNPSLPASVPYQPLAPQDQEDRIIHMGGATAPIPATAPAPATAPITPAQRPGLIPAKVTSEATLPRPAAAAPAAAQATQPRPIYRYGNTFSDVQTPGAAPYTPGATPSLSVPTGTLPSGQNIQWGQIASTLPPEELARLQRNFQAVGDLAAARGQQDVGTAQDSRAMIANRLGYAMNPDGTFRQSASPLAGGLSQGSFSVVGGPSPEQQTATAARVAELNKTTAGLQALQPPPSVPETAMPDVSRQISGLQAQANVIGSRLQAGNYRNSRAQSADQQAFSALSGQIQSLYQAQNQATQVAQAARNAAAQQGLAERNFGLAQQEFNAKLPGQQAAADLAKAQTQHALIQTAQERQLADAQTQALNETDPVKKRQRLHDIALMLGKDPKQVSVHTIGGGTEPVDPSDPASPMHTVPQNIVIVDNDTGAAQVLDYMGRPVRGGGLTPTKEIISQIQVYIQKNPADKIGTIAWFDNKFGSGAAARYGIR